LALDLVGWNTLARHRRTLFAHGRGEQFLAPLFDLARATRTAVFSTKCTRRDCGKAIIIADGGGKFVCIRRSVTLCQAA
jgi:hypothetical protein